MKLQGMVTLLVGLMGTAVGAVIFMLPHEKLDFISVGVTIFFMGVVCLINAIATLTD